MEKKWSRQQGGYPGLPAASREARMAATVHQFVVRDSEGLSISMETFRGKVLLVVNVASR